MRNNRSGHNTEHLLDLARFGDASAFERLLALTRKYLSLVARAQIGHRLQGKADASDIVQEALLEIHRHFDAFRGTTEAEFAAWARSILAGLVANHVRRFLGTKRRDVRLERSLAVELEDSSHGIECQLGAAISSPSENAQQRESALLLVDALERLPDHYRQVIVLRHVDGRSFADVAQQMGRSVDSVEKLWVRALARLRQSLAEKV